MIIKFCENILSRIHKQKTVYIERLCSGGFQTLDEYKFISGKLNGLEESEILIRSLYKDMFEGKQLIQNHEGDDDEQQFNY